MVENCRLGGAKMARRQKPKTGKWLLLCFPYGLYLMCRRNCRWHPALKGLITAGFAALAIGILAMPSPGQTTSTSVKMVKAENKVQVFGPEMPAGYDASAYLVPEGGENLIAPEEEETATYVYCSASKGSTYYHTSKCKYAYASAPRVTLYEAYLLGYTTPCGICNPPLYNPATGQEEPNPNAVGAAQ